MMEIRRYDELGRANYGWLRARYHFSFARYLNRARMGFGPLRVVNDDRIAAGHGFDPHPHEDMEIITYVREGSVRHRDSMGNAGVTRAGEVQVMSAGTGVEHAEYGDPDVETRLYQIWIEPREDGVKPQWAQRAFASAEDVADAGPLRLLVSGKAEDAGQGALYIHQDARIWGGTLAAGQVLEHDVGPRAYLLVSKGAVHVPEAAGGQLLVSGDAAALLDEPVLTLTGGDAGAEVLIIELPR